MLYACWRRYRQRLHAGQVQRRAAQQRLQVVRTHAVNPAVILGAARPVVQRFRMTPDEFAARYRRLTLAECPEGSSIVVTITDGVARYIIEVPSQLIHNGMRSDPR